VRTSNNACQATPILFFSFPLFGIVVVYLHF